MDSQTRAGAVVALPFAPAFYRVFTGFSSAQVKAFLNSPLIENLFYSVWLIGLWGVLIAGAMVMLCAHLRLALALSAR